MQIISDLMKKIRRRLYKFIRKVGRIFNKTGVVVEKKIMNKKKSKSKIAPKWEHKVSKGNISRRSHNVI